MKKNDYSKLEKVTGIKFNDQQLIDRAFTHKSFINENKDEELTDNERLEFLGDAVLELAATVHLFEKYPEKDEGRMTAFRSALVKGKHLAKVATNLELGQYLYLSNGEERSGGREKSYILANVVEAVIGAVYLEHGFKVAEKFIASFILNSLDQIIEEGLHLDAKSKFQEIAQEKTGSTPNYDLIAEEGPDHDKTFTMGVFITNEKVAEGTGSSKQKAEENAAENALKAKGW
jgi:ribonuclease III